MGSPRLTKANKQAISERLRAAREVAGYPTVLAHGMLTMGMTARCLTDWFGIGRLTRYGVRFVGQVWPGDTLTARTEVTAIEDDEGGPRAEVVVVTSDNPRSEDPAQIIDQIRAGIAGPVEVVVEPDRAAAIRLAVGAARPGDVVLLAA